MIHLNNMKLDKIHGNEITATFSVSDLETINNALNEVCNALDLDDFQTRIGVTMDEALILLAHISEVLKTASGT